MRRVVLGLLIVIVLSGGGYWAYRQYLAPQPEEDTAVTPLNMLSVNTDVDVVSSEGQIVPRRHANLSFQMGGRVAAVLVNEGDVVAVGEPLLRLEATDLENGVAQAELAVAQAEAGWQVAQQQLALAQAGVTEAQVGISAAETQLALLTADPSPEQIALTASQVAIAEAGITQAAADRDLVLEGVDASQLRAAEAQLNAAVAQRRPIRDAYDQILRLGITGDTEEQTRYQLTAAEADVIAAQAALAALNEGATSAQRQAAVAAVQLAESQQAIAQARLDLLLAGVKPEQITMAEIGVMQAENGVVQAETAVTQAEAAVAQAQAGITQAQAALTAAQTALDRATLTAPFAGTIANLTIETGEVVAAGSPIVTLADFGDWQIETSDLTELDIVAVAIGLPVAVNVDALPGEVLRGTVSDIAAISGVTRGDVTYRVTIDLAEADEFPLRWGMTVFVDIDVD
jgi:HlyD family secretion protein